MQVKGVIHPISHWPFTTVASVATITLARLRAGLRRQAV